MSKPKRAWYYVDLDGAQQGPVDESTLKAEYRTGEVDGMSLLWRPGQKGGWLKLDDLSSLKTRITQASTPSFSSGGDGGSSFGLDNTSFGIVTNSTSRRNRLNFSALHQSSNAFTVDSSLSLGLGGNRKNNKKTAKEKEKEMK